MHKLKSKPSDTELLDLYKYFKQAEIGDVNTDRPGLLDLKGKAKWDAWQSVKGLSQDEAREKYIALVEELVAKYGTN